MAHIGMFCLPATGHLNPLAALAYELKTRGHSITFFNLPDLAESVERRGFRFEPLGEVNYPGGALKADFGRLAALEGPAAMQFTFAMIARYEKAVLDEGGPVLNRNAVDFCVIDQLDYGAAALARICQIPFVTVSLALMMNEEDGVPRNAEIPSDDPEQPGRIRAYSAVLAEALQPILELVNQYLRKHNLEPVSSLGEVWSPLAQISQEPAQFEFPRTQLPPWFHFTGPFTRPETRPTIAFPEDRLNGKPLVYASFGTVQNRLLPLFEAVAAATAELDVQLVISFGGQRPSDVPRLAGNPVVLDIVPQLKILQRAAVMVTHAGLNSALECLAAGVPMVAIPITNDQPGVSARIVWTGTGVRLLPEECTPDTLRTAIAEVIGNPSYREAAQRFRHSIAETNGLARAAAIVEQAVHSRAPVLRR